MWTQFRKHFVIRSLEWFNAMTLFSWGSYVTLHPTLFSQSGAEVLVSIMPQCAWGYSATVIALVQVFSLFVNGRWGLTPVIRAATSILSVGAWFFITVGIRNTGPDTDAVIYPALMLAGVFSVFRAASDAAEVSYRKKLSSTQTYHGNGETSNVRTLVRAGNN